MKFFRRTSSDKYIIFYWQDTGATIFTLPHKYDQ